MCMMLGSFVSFATAYYTKGKEIMAKPKNVLVAQSGGPSPVINNSLRAVVENCCDYPAHFGTVYGAWHGIEGVLKEESFLAQFEHEKAKYA